MRYCVHALLLFLLSSGWAMAQSQQTARTRLADGFDMPVGKPDAEGYYMSRGFRARFHMGEDWNGLKGGDSDLGAPVYCTAHGLVVLARDARMGWGNLVIVRHAFLEEGRLKIVDSVYAHLDRITVREGQQVVRGQQVGTIGTNHGMYTAHLHFEIRKNLAIGANQRQFQKDLSNYHTPRNFIEPRRKLRGAGRSALVPINTFPFPPPAAKSSRGSRGSVSPSKSSSEKTTKPKTPFRVNRFEDRN